MARFYNENSYKEEFNKKQNELIENIDKFFNRNINSSNSYEFELKKSIDNARRQFEQAKKQYNSAVMEIKKSINKTSYNPTATTYQENIKTTYDRGFDTLPPSVVKACGHSIGRHSSSNANNTKIYEKNDSQSHSENLSKKQYLMDYRIKELIRLRFTFSEVEINTIDGVEYYDVTFYSGMNITDKKLELFEGGDVIEWIFVKKSGLKNIFTPPVQKIKKIRIEKNIIEENYKKEF